MMSLTSGGVLLGAILVENYIGAADSDDTAGIDGDVAVDFQGDRCRSQTGLKPGMSSQVRTTLPNAT